MKLNLNQIKEITLGAVRIEENEGFFNFFRFTKEQEELYKAVGYDSYIKTFSTAGIKLSFKTDSKTLLLNFTTKVCSSRKYFSFDVFVNGKNIGYLDNFEVVKLPEDYTKAELPLGEFSKAFDLGDGIKDVCVHFPWSVNAVIKEISLDDGALLEAVRPDKKMLIYGDSITQGYDVLRPSMHYAARLSEAFGAEGYNKAIGGEVFLPELAQLKDDFTPHYITVAYGTNDWGRYERETFKDKCKAFYKTLSENYPDTKIFAITPIWRKELNEIRKFGKFTEIETEIENAVKNLKNVTLISGFDLVVKDEKYYADFRLHPNDKGFDFYYNNLYLKLK